MARLNHFYDGISTSALMNSTVNFWRQKASKKEALLKNAMCSYYRQNDSRNPSGLMYKMRHQPFRLMAIEPLRGLLRHSFRDFQLIQGLVCRHSSPRTQ